MNILYILQNQEGYFLGNKGLLGRGSSKSGVTKEHEWVDGREAGTIFRTEHKDEAVNMRVEINSQDVEVRMSIKEVASTLKRHPVIMSEDLPPPLPKNACVLALCEGNNPEDSSLSNDASIETPESCTINESLDSQSY